MTELTFTQAEAETPTETQGAGGPPAKVKPHGKWVMMVNYEPEKGSRQQDFETPSSEYAKRFGVRESIQPVDEDKKPKGDVIKPGFRGVMLTPVTERQKFIRFKPVTINSMKEVRNFFDSPEGKKKRMMEQCGLNFDFDSGQSSMSNTQLIDTEFVPLLGGPFYKQLYLYDYLLMHARAFELKNHDALAAAAVKIMTRFVVGRGLSFHIKHDGARKVWEEFVRRNKLSEKVRTAAADLCWQGELMSRYYEPKRGYTTLRLLDASTCWEVVTDPEDVETVYYYHFQWPAPYQIWVTGNIPVTEYIIQQIPPTNVQHLKINVSAQERRGRSDLLATMPWLKRFRDFYNGQTVKALLEANLVWKIKVKGDQADVDAFLSNPALTELPPPGGVWIENEAVDLTIESANMTSGARGSSGIGQQIAAVVATSLNLPNEYFNIEAGAGGARATALVRTDPAVKAIEDRQQLIREYFEEMYNRVQANALMAGRIPREAAREEPGTQPAHDDETPSSAELAQLLPSNVGQRVAQARLVRG
jgi:hypothetical protein